MPLAGRRLSKPVHYHSANLPGSTPPVTGSGAAQSSRPVYTIDARGTSSRLVWYCVRGSNPSVQLERLVTSPEVERSESGSPLSGNPIRLCPIAGSGAYTTQCARCTRALRIQHIAPAVPSADHGRQVLGHTRIGADAGNRTPLNSLEGWRPTNGPHPQFALIASHPVKGLQRGKF